MEIEGQRPDLNADRYLLLAMNLCTILRGCKSQRQASEELGFSFNQLGKWESGATRVSWEDFVRLAGANGISIEEKFRKSFLWIFDGEFTPPNCVHVLIRFFGWQSTSEVAKSIGRHRSAVERWLSGATKPQLTDMLQMMDARAGALTGWLLSFVDPKDLYRLGDSYVKDLLAMEALLDNPEALLVNAALHCTQVQSSTNPIPIIERLTGLNHRSVEIALDQLLRSGYVFRKDKRLFSVRQDLTFLRHPKFRQVTKYLTQMAAERFPAGAPAQVNIKNPSVSSSRIAALSESANKKLSDLIVRFHLEASAILSQDPDPKDHIRIVLLHSFVSNIEIPATESEKALPKA